VRIHQACGASSGQQSVTGLGRTAKKGFNQVFWEQSERNVRGGICLGCTPGVTRYEFQAGQVEALQAHFSFDSPHIAQLEISFRVLFKTLLKTKIRNAGVRMKAVARFAKVAKIKNTSPYPLAASGVVVMACRYIQEETSNGCRKLTTWHLQASRHMRRKMTRVREVHARVSRARVVMQSGRFEGIFT